MRNKIKNQNNVIFNPVYIMIVFLLCMATFASARGLNEKQLKIDIKSSKATSSIIVDISLYLGLTNVQIKETPAQGKNIIGWIMKINDSYYASKNITGLTNQGIDNILDSFEKNAASFISFPFTTTGNVYFDESAMTIQGINSGGVEPCRFTISRYDQKMNIKIAWIETGDNCKYIECTIEPEFFKGEKALFTKPPEKEEQPYDNKCLTLLREAFGTGGKPLPRNVAFESSASKIFSEGIPSVDFVEIRITKEHKENLLKAIASHFEFASEKRNYGQAINEVSFPYLEIANEKLNECIYGDQKNKYISTYLMYGYDIRKPVLSEIIQSRLNNKNDKLNPDFALSYNYLQYDSISSSDSDKIAKNALKYLTWGVEYTPWIKGLTFAGGKTKSEVFDSFKDKDGKTVIDRWVGTGRETTALRQSNYRHAETNDDGTFTEIPLSSYIFDQSSSRPGMIQVFEGDFTANYFKIIGKLQSSNRNMKMSKIDLWTSISLSWDKTRINAIFAKNQENSADLPGRDVLNDKLIFQSNSLKIVRNETNPIIFGYSFNAPERIGGLLLIRDEVIKNTGKLPSNIITLQYKEPGGAQKSLLPTKNVAFSMNATESGGQGPLENAPSNAVNGKIDDIRNGKEYKWMSDKLSTGPQYIDIDLGVEHEIGKIEIYWGKEYATEYKIEGGDRARNNWFLLVPEEITKKRNGGVEEYYITDTRKAHHFRLTGTKARGAKNEADSHMIIKEIRVFKKGVALYASDLAQNSLAYYGGLNNDEKKKPDYGYYYNTNASPLNLSYTYFILYPPIVCNGISLYDNTKNSLNISELIAFPENPVNFSTKDNEGNIPFLPEESLVFRKKSDGKPDISGTPFLKEDPGKILLNGNKDSFLQLENNIIKNDMSINYFEVNLSKTEDIKTVAFWEPSAQTNADSTIYNEPLLILTGHEDLGESFYFSTADERLYYKSLFSEHLVTTPFFALSPLLDLRAGNPLPYAASGIDSPRTFNYKMLKQWEARNWFRNTFKKYDYLFPSEIDRKTTRAMDYSWIEKYESSYLDETRMLKAIFPSNDFSLENNIYMNESSYPDSSAIRNNIKDGNSILMPYLPGREVENAKGFIERKSPFEVDKIAGVDSIGILSGSISMANINSFGDLGLVDIFNRDVGDDLDRYFGMKAGVNTPGTFGGEPCFYSNIGGSCVDGTYRFKMSDLEKITIIVPDINEVRVGDLLVKCEANKEPHIGVIVKVPSIWSDLHDRMAKILVVSTRKGMRCATLGSWGNRNNLFGGFTTEPEKYHVRRLLKLTSQPIMVSEYDKWEPVKDYVEEIEVRVTLPEDPYASSEGNVIPDHWIPNTDEPLGARDNNRGMQVQIKAKSADSNDLPVGDNFIIIPLPPEDPSYKIGYTEEQKDSKSPNIYINKGDGITLFAVDDSEKDADGKPVIYRIAQFNRKDPTRDSSVSWDNITGKTYYKDGNFNTDFFNSDGSPRIDSAVQYKNIRIASDKNGYLSFEFERISDGKKYKSSTFAVKATGSMIRPGDDFFLRFGILGQADAEIKTRPGDFIAVYDKKLLWRANLYIDEKYRWNSQVFEEGNIDWNDINTWNDSTNEWKEIKDYFTDPINPNPPTKNYEGKQIPITPWTHPETYYYFIKSSYSIQEFDTNVINKLPYNDRATMLLYFNKNLTDGKYYLKPKLTASEKDTIINLMLSVNFTEVKINVPIRAANGSIKGSIPYCWKYELYDIPLDYFENKIIKNISKQSDRLYILDSYIKYANEGFYRLAVNKRNNEDNVKREGIIRAVIVKYAIKNIVYRNEPNDKFTDFQYKMSEQAKVLQNKIPNRSEEKETLAPSNNWDNYDSSSNIPALGYYNSIKPEEQKQGIPTGLHCVNFVYNARVYNDTPYQSGYDDYWLIGATVTPFDNKILSGDTRCIVPGDIVSMPNHWAIVNKIKYNPETREAETGNITFIHATPWGEYWYVQNRHNLSDFIFAIGSCELKRPKIK